jgi:hypothetical protein
LNKKASENNIPSNDNKDSGNILATNKAANTNINLNAPANANDSDLKKDKKLK